MKTLLLLAFLFGVATGNAQTPVWAFNVGGGSADSGNIVETDNSGNIYVLGQFSGTVDFDFGPGVAMLVSTQGTTFIAKYNSQGAYLWAVNLAIGVSDIAIDQQGHIVIIGSFWGSRDFDPGAGVFQLTSYGGSVDGFILKLNSGGGIVWAFQLGDIYQDGIESVTMDLTGNIYLSGFFRGQVDFEPSSGVLIETAPTSNLYLSFFLAKYSPNGSCYWVRPLYMTGPSTTNYANTKIEISASGQIYLFGSFRGTMCFGGSSCATSYSGTYDGYICKYDNNGNYSLFQRIGISTSGDEHLRRLSFDADSNIILTGSYQGGVVFSPVFSVGQPAWFLMKMNESLSTLWSFGTKVDIADVTTDQQSNILCLAAAASTVDIDPGTNIYMLPGSGKMLIKYSGSSELIWAARHQADDIVTDNQSKIIATGSFLGTVDFDPTTSTSFLTSSGGTDVSIVKLHNPSRQSITYVQPSPKVYGDTSFLLGATSSAGLSITYSSSNILVVTLSGATASIVGAGNATITASQPGNADWLPATPVQQTLVVNKAPLTATASSAVKVYGTANPTFSFSYSGFVNGENASVLDSPPTVGSAATNCSNVGTYPVTLSGGTDNNYTITNVNGTLTVNKANLTVTADNKSKTYNTPNPALTFSYSGFVCSDNASVIDVAPTVSTSATTTSNAGTYPITLSGGSDNNYNLNLVNGTLTINKANQTISFPALPIICGGGSATLFASASSGLPISYTSSNQWVATIFGNTANVTGPGTTTITASQPGNVNYNAAVIVQQSLTVSASTGYITQTGDLCQNGYVVLTAGPGYNYSWGTNQLVVYEPGLYSVNYNNPNGCSVYAEMEVFRIEQPGGMPCAMALKAADSEVRSFNVYPSPADEDITVEWGLEDGKGLILVIDALGRTLLSAEVSLNQNRAILDSRNWPAGVYYIRFGDRGLHKRVVVRH